MDTATEDGGVNGDGTPISDMPQKSDGATGNLAECSSTAAGVPLPEDPLYLLCADREARIDLTENFTMMKVYVGASLAGSSFTWGLALPDQAKGWRSGGSGYFTSGDKSDPKKVVYTGTIKEPQAGTAQLEIAKAPHPQTDLRCARLVLTTSKTTAYELSCFATGDAARGLCDRYGYPGDGVLYDEGKFILSFLKTPPKAHVEQVMAQVKAIGGKDLSEVTVLSDTGGLYAYKVHFHASVPLQTFRPMVTGKLCPLAKDLRVDYDAPVGPTP